MSEKKDVSKSSVENETRYSLDELCENSLAVFGKKKEVVIGAMHNAYKATDGSYTKQEVQEAIDKFLKKEVK